MAVTQNKTTILLIEDDDKDRRMLLGPLRANYQVEVAADYTQAKEKIEKGSFDVVFLDLMLPRRQGDRIEESGKLGLELLKMVRVEEPLVPVVVISALTSVKTAMKVLQEGIVDFIVKDDLEEQLPVVMKKAELIRQGRIEQLILRREARWPDGGQKLVYQSKAMETLLAEVKSIARDDASALILGETGVGKELIAREIHASSPRAQSQFVAINCGAVSSTLIESELFGHEKAAFTGADRRKYGLIELAHQGTLFLDEIADLPIDLQVKLLRVLQEGVFRRVGGEKELPVNIRVIAATNKDLSKEIEAGRFRQDLFYRLAVAKLNVPPLRERPEDVDCLAVHFIEKYRPRSGFSVSPKLLKVLKKNLWPGNVRELENVIHRMLIAVGEKGKVFQSADAKGYLETTSVLVSSLPENEFDLVQIEKQMIIRAMECFGTQSVASKHLGISESQLRRKLKDYGIEYLRRPTAQKQGGRGQVRQSWRSQLNRLMKNSTEFSTQQAIDAMGGISRKTAIGHLNLLTNTGELVRITRGKYRPQSNGKFEHSVNEQEKNERSR